MISKDDNCLTLDDIRYLCSKFSSILNIPSYFLNAYGDILFEYSYEYSKNPLYENKQQALMEFANIGNAESYFNLISTKYYENYFSIKIYNSENLLGTILVGPSITKEMDDKSLDLLINNLNIPIKYKQDLVNYYNHTVLMDYNRFVDSGLFIYYSIYRQTLDILDIEKNNQTFTDFSSINKSIFDISESKKRRDSIFHHPQKFERDLLECIEEGDLEKLTKFLKSNSVTGEKGIHSKNPLRSEKNIFISFTSLVSHAAIKGGLDWELSLSLSDFYILSVEECNSINEVYDLFAKLLIDYAERVHRIKKCKYSYSILKCQNFIFEHLYEKITLTELAKNIGINSSYLSHLFKKEVGVSISEYIQSERIKEAQKLIRAGEKSLSDIYVPLGFIDQSHFTKAFKKVTGITPKEYRLLYK
ncbi:helix-turn-helix domain-containing protein [Clostridium diolis]|uniref:helix-turn-helix domain-containing protein n=1 Tax=Clostridium diolis TaxID=223919 RepID=UPI003AF8E421